MLQKQKGVLYFTVFIDMVCFSMIFPVLPYLVKEMGLSTISIGIIVSIFPLMNFLCSSYWGSLSDKVGRRPIMLLSIGITLGANVLLAFSHIGLLLFMARLLAGIGSANIGVAQAYITDISTAETRTKNLGMVGAMFGLGFIVGPFVGSILKEWSGAGSALYVGLGAALLNGLNLISAHTYLTESNKHMNADGKRTLNPFTNIIHWLQVPVVKQLMFLFFIYVTAFSMMQVTSGFLWASKYGISEREAGYLFVFIGVCSVVFQGALVGILVKKMSSRQMIMSGGIVMAIALALIPLPSKANFWPVELCACALLSLGNACITPPLQSWITKVSGAQVIGQALGANQSFGSIGRVIGPALGTILFAYDMNIPFYVSACLMVVPLIIIFKLKA